MVREWRPPARMPATSWLARRSTMATSTSANASSPASISPVGPPPAITTACSVIATLRPYTSTTTHAFRCPHVRKVLACGRRLCGTPRGLPQAPPGPYKLDVEGSHAGYDGFRSGHQQLRKPMTGDLVWSVPTLATLNPIGAPIA